MTRNHCSKVLVEEYKAYQQRVRAEPREFPKKSKKWWRLNRQLLEKKGSSCGVPPLKNPLTGKWAVVAREKADLLAQSFAQKRTLLPAETAVETTEPPEDACVLGNFLVLRRRVATRVLKALDPDKATGPDLLPARLLQRFATELSAPVCKLTRLMLQKGVWPQKWRYHWVCPLHKKGAVSSPGNYRGVHLTSQVDKVVERLLGIHLDKFFVDSAAFGPNQFAYRKAHGYKDALALNTLHWVWNMAMGRKTGLYCSDVSGAFDRVDADRLQTEGQRNHG